eukprot:Rmarinus@m.12743
MPNVSAVEPRDRDLGDDMEEPLNQFLILLFVIQVILAGYATVQFCTFYRMDSCDDDGFDVEFRTKKPRTLALRAFVILNSVLRCTLFAFAFFLHDSDSDTDTKTLMYAEFVLGTLSACTLYTTFSVLIGMWASLLLHAHSQALPEEKIVKYRMRIQIGCSMLIWLMCLVSAVFLTILCFIDTSDLYDSDEYNSLYFRTSQFTSSAALILSGAYLVCSVFLQQALRRVPFSSAEASCRLNAVQNASYLFAACILARSVMLIAYNLPSTRDEYRFKGWSTFVFYFVCEQFPSFVVLYVERPTYSRQRGVVAYDTVHPYVTSELPSEVVPRRPSDVSLTTSSDDSDLEYHQLEGAVWVLRHGRYNVYADTRQSVASGSQGSGWVFAASHRGSFVDDTPLSTWQKFVECCLCCPGSSWRETTISELHCSGDWPRTPLAKTLEEGETLQR